MSEEKIKKLCETTFLENIMNNLDSALIFKYIQKLEQENQQLKENYEKESYLVDKLTRQLTDEYKNTNMQVEKVKQRDSIIEECIESIQNFMTHIDDGFCADMMTFIDILNKYKGDNNE